MSLRKTQIDKGCLWLQVGSAIGIFVLFCSL